MSESRTLGVPQYGTHSRYQWKTAQATRAHRYIVPALLDELAHLRRTPPLKILDVGCGNGYVASRVAALGHQVLGVDVSADGVNIARKAYPGVRFEVASVYDDCLQDLLVMRSTSYWRWK